MKLLASFTLLLTVSASSLFHLPGTGNETLQQQQKNEARLYSRIVKGERANHFQFPYQVGLQIRVAHNDYRRCSGSLISVKWVLTAAHCVHGGRNVFIHLGSIRFGTHYYKRLINKQYIIEHRDFNVTTLYHDIAVIRIPTVDTSRAIETIRLPRYVDNLESYDGAETFSAGWGQTSVSPTSTSSELMYSTFTVITNKKCLESHGKFRIYKGKLCTATSNGSSGCHGDSGGPLAYFHNKEKPIQIGIYSFSDYECKVGIPNGYTRVDYYLEWIHD